MKKAILLSLVLGLLAMSFAALASPIIVGGSYAAAGAGQVRIIEAGRIPDFVIIPVWPGVGGDGFRVQHSPIIVGGS